MEITKLAISIQEIELIKLIRKHGKQQVLDIISREYTGIDLDTEILLELVLLDIKQWNNHDLLRTCVSKCTQELEYKLLYLLLENIIELIQGDSAGQV